jgi:heterogeneous nuclear ribonucleoprotein A1/A3
MANKTLYIGNLSYRADEQDLERAFENFGEIEDIALMREPVTGKSRRFAFVTFEIDDALKPALEKMDGEMISGRAIRVRLAHEKKANNKRNNLRRHYN